MFKCWKFGVCRLESFKVINYQSWRSEEKVCLPAPATLDLSGPRSRSPGVKSSLNLMAGNFAALWSRDPKFSAFKHLNLLKKHTRNQETSSILRVGFALSKWPHLHTAYLLVPRLNWSALCLHVKNKIHNWIIILNKIIREIVCQFSSK